MSESNITGTPSKDTLFLQNLFLSDRIILWTITEFRGSLLFLQKTAFFAVIINMSRNW